MTKPEAVTQDGYNSLVEFVTSDACPLEMRVVLTGTAMADSRPFVAILGLIQAAEQRGMERAATYHDEIAKRHRTFALGLHRNTSAEAEHRLRQNWHEASAQAIRQGEQNG